MPVIKFEIALESQTVTLSYEEAKELLEALKGLLAEKKPGRGRGRKPKEDALAQVVEQYYPGPEAQPEPTE